MNSWQREWPAPAKLNLFLHVVGRRADGYHLLQTVFRFLAVGDSLSFAPREDGEIVLDGMLPGVPPERNLSVRAARALQQAAGLSVGVHIRLTKRLPVGGGLGGGSSDAATTLVALTVMAASLVTYDLMTYERSRVSDLVTLANIIARRRAEWLLSRADELFFDEPTP